MKERRKERKNKKTLFWQKSADILPTLEINRLGGRAVILDGIMCYYAQLRSKIFADATTCRFRHRIKEAFKQINKDLGSEQPPYEFDKESKRQTNE